MVYLCSVEKAPLGTGEGSGMLHGKVALVTGGGRGIGEAIARGLSKAGARVGVTGRTEAEIQKVASEIGGEFFIVDQASRTSTDSLAKTVEQTLGGVDILVNNAGIATSARYAKVRDEDWDKMMEVNCTSAFRITKALVPQMVEKGWGRVINIASNAGVSGYSYTAAYCASKHAMVGFTRALAVELAPTGVTINAICPGWVDTKMAADAAARISKVSGRTVTQATESLAKMSPQERIISADEVAHFTLALCNDLGAGMHGQTLVIDGGQILK